MALGPGDRLGPEISGREFLGGMSKRIPEVARPLVVLTGWFGLGSHPAK